MKRFKEDLKLTFIALISAIIHAFAITNFSIPANLYPSGFSGITKLTTDLLLDFANIYVPYAVLYFALNIIATVFVFNKIGKRFAIFSIIQFTLFSIFTTIFRPMHIVDDRLLQCIFGGILNGIGIGLALSFNFSTGGFDFINVYFANKFKKDIWNYIFIANCTILLISSIFYGVERALYSIIFQYSSTAIIKMMHQRYTHKTLTIITSMPDEVANEILRNIRHGITEIQVKGHYSHDNKTMLYTVVNSFQYREVIKIVMNKDPHAFINVQNTSAIYGNYYQKPLD